LPKFLLKVVLALLKKFLTISLTLTLILVTPSLSSASVETVTLWEDCKQLSRIPKNFIHLARSPLDWGEKDWLTAGGIAGTTLILMTLDGGLQEFIQDRKTSGTQSLSRLVKPFGEGTTTLPLMGGLYLYGLLEQDERARETALLATQSFFVAGFFSELVKTTFQRHRPSTGRPPLTFDGPRWPRENQSFASGHACVAFAVATVIAEKYSHNSFVRGAAYTLAGLTALSRVHDNDHWASDAFFGSALGFFTARGIINLHLENNQLEMSLTPGGVQISLSF